MSDNFPIIPGAAAALIAVAISALLLTRRSTPPITKKGERVVLLGGSAGIGRCIAHIYAKRGAKLLITSFNQYELDKVRAECISLGADPDSVATFSMDLTSEPTIAATAQRAKEWMNGVDTLLINAGTISVMSFEDLIKADELTPGHSSKSIEGVFKINSIGPIIATKHFLPLLKETRGRLVVTSSTAGLTGAPTRSLYCASKHAVQGFFDSLRIEIAHHGVSVGLVLPMTVNTNLRASAVDKVATPSATSAPARKEKKLEPEDVAVEIVRCSDLRMRSMFVPWWAGYIALARALFPSFVDGVAARKYKFAA
ncbi:NAD(P)-binding protein [Gonapodya prolifera JEL478]|uniref:NAD(P)-binding protein n=1 Tax=Gonapodya prolifera (strain JEL478) TaxID=1344416 RepID=A0A139AVR8_GONPJ|nr:NAD(P)-binding protein [Gonapodya prolifera JEL478]|eukprot:KXS20826.1 NAD(P)-binding protein [Gonapodya prolifera JEL478]